MKNDFEIRGDITAIYVVRKNGDTHEILVDTEDLELIDSLQRKIFVKQSGKIYAAVASKALPSSSSKWRVLGLHRFLMGDPEGLVIDHINHNTLDNRKSNLRAVTVAENGQNQVGAHVDSETGIRGVTFRKDRRKFQAQATVKGEHYYLGVYGTLEEASKVVEEFRSMHMEYSTEATNRGRELNVDAA